jgi:hypothetical protein
MRALATVAATPATTRPYPADPGHLPLPSTTAAKMKRASTMDLSGDESCTSWLGYGAGARVLRHSGYRLGR